MRTPLLALLAAGAVVVGGHAAYTAVVHPQPSRRVLSQVLVIPTGAPSTALGPAVSTSAPAVTSAGRAGPDGADERPDGTETPVAGPDGGAERDERVLRVRVLVSEQIGGPAAGPAGASAPAGPTGLPSGGAPAS